MRIAYLIAWRGGADSGVHRKVSAQVGAWQEAGHEVALFVATSAASAEDWSGIAASHHRISTDMSGKLAERTGLARAAVAWAPHLIYERHGLYYPGHGRLARRVPVVTEINGNDIAEWKLLSRPKAFYNRVTRQLGFARLSGLVFVAEELRRLAGYRSSAGRIPFLVLGNGIDLKTVAHAGPAAVEGLPRLVFVGHHSTPWHGVDDLLALARARPEWRFDVVGLPASELSGASGNVVAHGQLHPSRYSQVLAAADIGIGPLALYRKRLTECSALKVREYLATGLPVVIGAKDTDFLGGAPFILEVPNRPRGVLDTLPELDAFVARWRGRRVPRAAVAHLHATLKEEIRLAFFDQVLSKGRTR